MTTYTSNFGCDLSARRHRVTLGDVSAIGFLHTSSVHVPTFRDLVAELAPRSSTAWVVDERLLERARRFGAADPQVADGIARALAELDRQGADVVVCTCSTIGGAAEIVGRRVGVAVVRVDRAMAERAVAIGGKVRVVAALENTLAPTLELLESVAADHGLELDVEVEMVAGAWERFEADDGEGYLAVIADALAKHAVGCDVIVLAQASMAEAADRVAVGVPVLSSPRLAVAALAEC